MAIGTFRFKSSEDHFATVFDAGSGCGDVRRRHFRAGAIFNLHAATSISSNTRFLQDARGDGNVRAACVQHHRERCSRTTAIPKYFLILFA